MSNTNLIHAKRQKNDEFYTQLRDIETEMQAYLEYDPDVFRDKTVLLPCDDPDWSNFTKYFAEQFEYLGIKKLISTSYAADGHGKVFVLDHNHELQWECLTGDGDFRSAEVTALRDEADMVITNPPFSLFREFMAWLRSGDVEFSVIGNMSAIICKGIFPLIRDNRLWLGRGRDKGGNSMWFEVPKDYPPSKHEQIEDDGTRVTPVSSKWFTNIQHGHRHKPLKLMTQADNEASNKRIINNANSYKKYDNYDAIEVPATSGIPSDYVGVMGVPISFLDKHCPEQFEIVGYMASTQITEYNFGYPYVDGQKKYSRILIRHINPATQEAAVQLAQVHTLKTATPEQQQMAA